MIVSELTQAHTGREVTIGDQHGRLIEVRHIDGAHTHIATDFGQRR